nr:MAG TPA: hypothetical protein [Caudoviricetes sp.]
MRYCHLHPIRYKHVTFSWSYAEPVLGPCVSLQWKPFIYSVHTGMPLKWYLTPTRKGLV